MSNKSRGRHRFNQPDTPPPDPKDEATAKAAAEAFETANTRAGLSKLVGLVMGDRDKQKAERGKPRQVDPNGPKVFDPDAKGLRAPTPFEMSVVSALGNHRTVTINRPNGPPGHRVMTFPLHQVSDAVYGGTVEPWRVEARRRRNKAARKARVNNSRHVAGVGGASKSASRRNRKAVAR